MAFQSPNYTQVPNELFELMADMSESELKVVLAIVRKTMGYHVWEVMISIRDLAEMTGLSTTSVMVGAQKAEERGLIEAERDGQRLITYRLSVDYPVSKSDTQKLVGVSNSDTSPVSKSDTVSSVNLLNKDLKKEVEKEIGTTPATSSSILPMICKITGLSYIPPAQMQYVEPLYRLVEDHGYEKVKEVLTRNYQKWRLTPRKNMGGTFSPLNFGWVDWAQAELIGAEVGTSPRKKWAEMTSEEQLDILLAGGKKEEYA